MVVDRSQSWFSPKCRLRISGASTAPKSISLKAFALAVLYVLAQKRVIGRLRLSSGERRMACGRFWFEEAL